MAKTMARLENGIVVNLEWVDDRMRPTDDLVDVYDLQIKIGDRYSKGIFYRNDVEVLTYRQQMRNILKSYDNALTEIEESIATPMLFNMRGTTITTIEDRKQNILSRIEDILVALETLEVVPSE